MEKWIICFAAVMTAIYSALHVAGSLIAQDFRHAGDYFFLGVWSLMSLSFYWMYQEEKKWADTTAKRIDHLEEELYTWKTKL